MNHLTELIILAVIIVGVVIAFLRQNAYKTTQQQLQRLPKGFRVKSHIIVKNDRDEDIVIEHLIVSKAGIFIINVEDYNGKIIGEEPDQTWVAKSKRGTKNFTNPTLNNFFALKSLRKRINDPNFTVPIYPVVVFGKKADLSDVITESPVIRSSNLLRYLQRFQEEKLTDLEQEAIFSKI